MIEPGKSELERLGMLRWNVEKSQGRHGLRGQDSHSICQVGRGDCGGGLKTSCHTAGCDRQTDTGFESVFNPLNEFLDVIH